MPCLKGQYFLMPFKGTRLENLVRVIRRAPTAPHEEIHRVKYLNRGYVTTANLSACKRISESVALRILASKKK